MANSDISIRLGNDTGQVRAEAFVDSIRHTLTILGCVEAELTLRESGSIRWMLQELSYSSPAQATLRPEHENTVSAQVVSATLDGLNVLSRGQSQPRHFSASALLAARNLSKIAEQAGYRVSVVHQSQTVAVAGLSRTAVADTAAEYFHSTGSVEGRLETASVRSRPYLRVYDAVHDRGVTCYFSDSQLGQVRKGLGKRVIVSGNVKSDRLGNPESIRVSNIEIADDVPAPVTPSELRGLWRGETEGQTAEQYLREVRGDC